MHGRGAQSCALPKNGNETLQATESFACRFLSALGGDDGIAGFGRTLLRLFDAAVALARRSSESARDVVGGSAQGKRRGQCADRSPYITQRSATPAEGGLPQDGSDYGTKHRAACSNSRGPRRKCHSPRG